MKRPVQNDGRGHKILTRRALVLGGAQAGVVGLLGWRMKSMQVEQAQKYRLLAEENRININLLPPARGLIFDIEGREIAANEQLYRIVMVREQAGDIGETLEKLTRLIPIAPEDLTRAMEELNDRPPFVRVTIADRVPWEHVARISVNTPALPGVIAEVGLSRVYPEGDTLAHVVGYVGPVSDYDLSRLDDQDPVLQIPRFQIGKTGVENKLERVLRGSAGTQQVEVNAAGRVMRELGRQPGIPGKDVQLTVDARLQEYIQARMDGQSAAAVVIDLENGDLRAVASTPSLDPNLFVRGISTADWKALNEEGVSRENQRRPLAAKAVQGAYPPGSTFKMVTALAALEAGEVDPEETVWCPGYLDVFDVRFHCWRRGGHGNVNLNESLKESCDVYYYEIAQRVGIDRIAEMARKLGIGVKHDVPLSAVTDGMAPDKAWKRARYGEDWRIGDTVNASIGQGYVLASPLQLAVMTARIATGREIRPRLVKSIGGVPEPSGTGPSLGLNENHLIRVRRAMFDVVNDRRGTAYGSRTVDDAIRMAGKTGTSQVRRITAEERAQGITRNEDLPWHRRDHALFVNFAPYDNPRIAVAVVVEHGGGGSKAAAPIARDITLQALYGGTPPLEAYPSSQRDTISRQQQEISARAEARAAARSRNRA